VRADKNREERNLKMKKLLLAIIIILQSYYPVYAGPVLNKEEIFKNGEIIHTELRKQGERNYNLSIWMRVGSKLYWCMAFVEQGGPILARTSYECYDDK
jgi:hypothetical protein